MFRLLFLFLILSTNLIGQSFQYGIGVYPSFGYLVFNDKTAFETLSLKPSISTNPGIRIYAEVQTSEAFQFQLVGQIGQSAIQLTQKLGGFSNYKSSIKYPFLALDLTVLARYKLEKGAKWKYYPSLGINIGFQDYQGYVISGGINAGAFNAPILDLGLIENQHFVTPNIHIGMGIRPPFLLFNRPIELNVSLLYGPRNFLENPINLGSVNNPLIIQGKYHSLSIGLNFYLRH